MCDAFLKFQIFSLIRALNWRRSANIQFASFKIDFLGNQLKYRLRECKVNLMLSIFQLKRIFGLSWIARHTHPWFSCFNRIQTRNQRKDVVKVWINRNNITARKYLVLCSLSAVDLFSVWRFYQQSLLDNLKKRYWMVELRALNWRRCANIQFANFKIDSLGNQSKYRKSLTHFCSLSPTDWHCAVCLVVRVNRKAGNSV